MNEAISTTTRSSRLAAIAKIVSEILAPWVVIILLALAMAFKATDFRPGATLLWAMVVIVFSAGIPMAVIVKGARAGRWDGHHVRNREGRTVPLLVCLGSTATGLLILIVGGGPRVMIATALAMFVVLVVCLAVTSRWKISMHTGVAGGGVAMLALLYSPLALLLLGVVAIIGWSRVVMRDHTLAQVLVGAVNGFIVSGAVYLLAT
jgi:membrane-associated phospholipid phosphatase